MEQNEKPKEQTPEHHIYHTLEIIKGLALQDPKALVDKDMAHRLAFLFSKFAEQADKSSKAMTLLTWVIAGLTVAMLAGTVVQICVALR